MSAPAAPPLAPHHVPAPPLGPPSSPARCRRRFPPLTDRSRRFIYDHSELTKALKRLSVAFVGGGAWACAAARMVAQNTMVDDPADEFVDDVKMWVHEREWDGRTLTEVSGGPGTTRGHAPCMRRWPWQPRRCPHPALAVRSVRSGARADRPLVPALLLAWPGGARVHQQVINETHENPAYMPGVDLGSNIKATADLTEAVRDADAIVLCVPHQFVHG